MIFLNNIGKFFEGKPLFRDANVSVHRGDRIGIVGPNGAGKSTLLGIMEGVVSADEGEVSIEKRMRMGVLRQELVQGNDRPILDEVMNVTDDLRQIQERLAILEEEMAGLSENSDRVDSVLEEHGRLQQQFESYGGYSLESRAVKVLAGLGFQADDVRRQWSEFSGGWRMRVALAKILLAEPDVLLLDEPTNHLDLESLLWVEEYLMGFQGAIVLVSHDRAFLNRLVRRIIEVDRGKVTTYAGNFDECEKTKAIQEGVLVASYRTQQEKIKRIQKFIDKNRVKARTASRVQSRLKMLEKIEKIELPTRTRTIHFNFPQPSRSGRRVVEIQGLVKRYGNKTVYDGFDFSLERGDRVAFVGPNGAGKSTLLKVIAGILPYEGGSMKYGHAVQPAYFAQHQYEHLNLERTALEEAVSSAHAATEGEVRTLLGAFLFSGEDVYKKVKVLSGGEKSRLALSKILLSPPNLLLMDEPTNHLDIPSCQVLEQGLKRFEGTLVLITHDRRLMNEICTGILEITADSKEYYPGNYDDYKYKKRLMASETVNQSSSETETGQAEHTASASGLEERKQRKRLQARVRNTLFRQRAPILEQIRQIELQMELKSARRKEMTDILADPETYRNKDLVRPLLEEEPILAKEIKELEARWEELHHQLEEIDATVLTG